MAKRTVAKPVPANKVSFQVGPYRVEKPNAGSKNRQQRKTNAQSVDVRQMSTSGHVEGSNPWHIVGIFGGDSQVGLHGNGAATKELLPKVLNARPLQSSSLNQSMCDTLNRHSQRTSSREKTVTNRSTAIKTNYRAKRRHNFKIGFQPPQRSKTAMSDLPQTVYDAPSQQVNIVSKQQLMIRGATAEDQPLDKNIINTQHSTHDELNLDPSENIIKTSTLSRIPTQQKDNGSAKRMSEPLTEHIKTELNMDRKEVALLMNSSAETVPHVSGKDGGQGPNTKVVLSVGEATQVGTKQQYSSFDNSAIGANDFAIVQQDNQQSFLDLDQRGFEADSAQLRVMYNTANGDASIDKPAPSITSQDNNAAIGVGAAKNGSQVAVTNIDFRQARQYRLQRSGVENPRARITFKLPSYSSCLRARVVPKNFPAMKHYYELLAKDEKLAKINEKHFFTSFDQMQSRSFDRRCSSTLEQPRSSQRGHYYQNSAQHATENGISSIRPQNQVNKDDLRLSFTKIQSDSLRQSQQERRRQVLLGNKRQSNPDIEECEVTMHAVFNKSGGEEQPQVTSYRVGTQMKHQLALKSPHLGGEALIGANGQDYEQDQPSMGTYLENSEGDLKGATVLSRKSIDQPKAIVNIKHLSTLKSHHASMNKISGTKKHITHQTLNMSSKLLIGPNTNKYKKQPFSTKSSGKELGHSAADPNKSANEDEPYNGMKGGGVESDIQTKLISHVGSEGRSTTEVARQSSAAFYKEGQDKSDLAVYKGEQKLHMSPQEKNRKSLFKNERLDAASAKKQNILAGTISFSVENEENNDVVKNVITGSDKQMNVAFRTNDLYSSRQADEIEEIQSVIVSNKQSRTALEFRHSFNHNTEEQKNKMPIEHAMPETISFNGQMELAIRNQAKSIELMKDAVLAGTNVQVFDSKGLSTIRQPSANESPSKQETIRMQQTTELKEIKIIAGDRQPNKNQDSEIRRKRLNDLKFNADHNRKMAKTPEIGRRIMRTQKSEEHRTDSRDVENEYKNTHRVMVQQHELNHKAFSGSRIDDPSLEQSNKTYFKIVQGQKSSVNESEMLGLLEMYLNRSDIISNRGTENLLTAMSNNNLQVVAQQTPQQQLVPQTAQLSQLNPIGKEIVKTQEFQIPSLAKPTVAQVKPALRPNTRSGAGASRVMSRGRHHNNLRGSQNDHPVKRSVTVQARGNLTTSNGASLQGRAPQRTPPPPPVQQNVIVNMTVPVPQIAGLNVKKLKPILKQSYLLNSNHVQTNINNSDLKIRSEEGIRDMQTQANHMPISLLSELSGPDEQLTVRKTQFNLGKLGATEVNSVMSKETDAIRFHQTGVTIPLVMTNSSSQKNIHKIMNGSSIIDESGGRRETLVVSLSRDKTQSFQNLRGVANQTVPPPIAGGKLATAVKPYRVDGDAKLHLEHVIESKRLTESNFTKELDNNTDTFMKVNQDDDNDSAPNDQQMQQFYSEAVSSENALDQDPRQKLIQTTNANKQPIIIMAGGSANQTDGQGQTVVQTLQLASDLQSLQQKTVGGDLASSDKQITSVGGPEAVSSYIDIQRVGTGGAISGTHSGNNVNLTDVCTPMHEKKDTSNQSSFRMKNRTPDFLKVLGGGQELIDSLMHPQMQSNAASSSAMVSVSPRNPNDDLDVNLQNGGQSEKRKFEQAYVSNPSSVQNKDQTEQNIEPVTLSLHGDNSTATKPHKASKQYSPSKFQQPISMVRVQSRESGRSSSHQRQLQLYADGVSLGGGDRSSHMDTITTTKNGMALFGGDGSGGPINIKDYFDRRALIGVGETAAGFYEPGKSEDLDFIRSNRPQTQTCAAPYTVPINDPIGTQTKGSKEIGYQLHKRFVTKKRKNHFSLRQKSLGQANAAAKKNAVTDQSQDRPHTMVLGKRLNQTGYGRTQEDQAAYQAFLEQMLEKRQQANPGTCVVKPSAIEGRNSSVVSSHTAYRDSAAKCSAPVTEQTRQTLNSAMQGRSRLETLEQNNNYVYQVVPGDQEKIIGVIGDFAAQEHIVTEGSRNVNSHSQSRDAIPVESPNQVAVKVHTYNADQTFGKTYGHANGQEKFEENSLRKVISSEDTRTEAGLNKTNLAKKSQEFAFNNRAVGSISIKKDYTIQSELESSPSLNYGNISQLNSHIYNNENTMGNSLAQSEQGGHTVAKFKTATAAAAASDNIIDKAGADGATSAFSNRHTGGAKRDSSSQKRKMSSSVYVRKGMELRSISSIEKDTSIASDAKSKRQKNKKSQDKQQLVPAANNNYESPTTACANKKDEFTLRMPSKDDNQTEEYYEEQTNHANNTNNSAQKSEQSPLKEVLSGAGEKKSVSVGTTTMMNPYVDHREFSEQRDTQEIAARVNMMVQDMSIPGNFGHYYEFPSTWKNRIQRGILAQTASMYRYQPRDKFQVIKPGGNAKARRPSSKGGFQSSLGSTTLPHNHYLKSYLEQGSTGLGNSRVVDSNRSSYSNSFNVNGGSATRARTTEPGYRSHQNRSNLAQESMRKTAAYQPQHNQQVWVPNDSPLHISGRQPISTALYQQFMPSTNAEKYISVFDEQQFEQAAKQMYEEVRGLVGSRSKSLASGRGSDAEMAPKPTIQTGDDLSVVMHGRKNVQHITGLNSQWQTLGPQVSTAKQGNVEGSITFKQDHEFPESQKRLGETTSMNDSSAVDSKSPVHVLRPTLKLRRESGQMQHTGEIPARDESIKSSFEIVHMEPKSNKNQINNHKVVTMLVKDTSGGVVTQAKSVEALFEQTSQQITIRTKNMPTEGTQRLLEETAQNLQSNIELNQGGPTEERVIETEELGQTRKSDLPPPTDN